MAAWGKNEKGEIASKEKNLNRGGDYRNAQLNIKNF